MFAWRRTALRRRVLVSLKTDKAIRGVLFARHGSLIVLKGAELLTAAADAARLDGEIIIDRANVDFIQVLATPLKLDGRGL